MLVFERMTQVAITVIIPISLQCAGRINLQKVEEITNEKTGSLDVYCERMYSVASTVAVPVLYSDFC